MSGSTIGGVIGGAIGWFVGGPAGAQWGWMIGSTVGGIVDPERIEGPRLGEAKTQTASDGVPLIYGYGTFPCAGNVAWVDEVKEHRNVESSKGGPEQVTYTYTISYMVVVCKGEISGLKLVRRNGKIVYDARTDSELTALGYSSQDIAETRAAQANFQERATIYYGTQDQMPDPTMVAVKGAGNVPAYTGVAYIVMKDDETQQGEYAQFEFVVANCGERHESEDFAPGVFLGMGRSGGLIAAVRELDDNMEWREGGDVTITNSLDSFIASAASMGGKYAAMRRVGSATSTTLFWCNTNDTTDWNEGATISFVANMSRFIGGRYWVSGVSNQYMGYLDHLEAPSFSTVEVGGFVSAFAGVGNTIVAAGPNNLIFRSIDGGSSFSLIANHLGSPQHSVNTSYAMDTDGLGRYAWGGLKSNVPYIYYSDDAGETVTEASMPSLPILSGQGVSTLKNVGGGSWLLTLLKSDSTSNGLLASTSNAESFMGVTLPEALYFPSEVSGGSIASGGGIIVIAGRRVSDGTRAMYWSNSDDFTTWNPIDLTGTSSYAIGYAPFAFNLVEIPDAPGYYVDPSTGQVFGPTGTQIDPCQPTLGEIVSDQCERRGVTSRDVSELTDQVGGYRVAKPSSSQANIQGLQPGYFFEASEFDGILHFPKRGRPVTFTLTHDDFLEREGDPIKWERTQERDFLRKVTVAYSDPETAWTPTTQQAERRATTISAEGESTLELPITGTKDWAAQTAHKSIKVAWGEPDQCTFHVTIDHANLVTGAEGLVPYTDGNPTQIRIDRIEDEGLTRIITGRITRPDLYDSNATGASKPLPQFPGSNIRGPTDGLLMNIPVLIDQDDRPGIHWAVSRMMSGWQGGTLQIRRAGQWVTVDTISESAGLGALTAPLPAHSGDIDTQNILSIRMNEELESVSWINLLNERNPLAILRPDGTAEIVQFQNATQTAPDEYDLTKLIRNRLDTGSWDHDTGARVVVLDSRVQYATLQATDLGQTLEYRFVSVGTDPDAAPIQTITLTTMESQREWPVYMLEVEQDGDDFILTWLARDRLGNDVIPIRSQNWAGYEASYSHSGGSGSVVVMTETHTFTLPGATDVTFSVAQLNQFTGAGPAETVTVP